MRFDVVSENQTPESRRQTEHGQSSAILFSVMALFSLAVTASIPSPSVRDISRRQLPHFLQYFINPIRIPYTPYKGDGSEASGWPSQSSWMPFQQLWFINQQAIISRTCDNTETETGWLLGAIHQVSISTSVDPRFILAVIIEESRGCVRVQSTSLAVQNPGLMQSYEGKGSCSDPVVQRPCPYAEIAQMLSDGTASNEAGVNLKDLIAASGKSDVSKYYIAARMYNSGPHSIPEDGELSGPGANPCYAADIANRLLGYVGGSCGVQA
ncbi:uncharacterized protein MYCFIDRAFT_150910 [Pseudocercospora fijiensis CIRAD86]|uniref:Transglycosylase SLT domain-containing protein n=1 Tax=Pseudocercospora fijiensis (strain CIRAD86) TaxID=383855 RepID=M3AMQ3_PSEFD|nr:uncharacterized protein MYCFIDRAFT_150910 [Pseudocercospora fijiensis CIRAD86]EME85861.1 hypothetical protein MYCFIDRAFT_150910 [Pseudocercospora fijiensis CIRAD86]